MFLANTKGQSFDYRHFTKYSQTQGISSYNVKKIYKDSKGFLWVATQDGINRFDGNYFIKYTSGSETKHQISGADVREIIEDTINKKLWIIPTQGAINSIDLITGNVIDVIKIPYDNPEGWSLCMQLHDDKLWIGSFTGVKVYNIQTGKYDEDLALPFNADFFKGSFEASKIFKDSNGNIWVCYCNYGVVIYSTTGKKIIAQIPFSAFKENDHITNMKFNDALFTNPNEVLLATNQGVKEIKFNSDYEFQISEKPFQKSNTLNNEYVEAISMNSQNEIFIAARSGLYRFDNKLSDVSLIKETLHEGEGNWLNSIHCIFQDTINSITWIGAQQGIAFFKTEKRLFSSYYFDELSNVKFEHLKSILPIGNGKVLVGLLNGLGEVDTKTKKAVIIDKNNTYYHSFKDPFNRIHVSKDDGMYIYEKGVLTEVAKVYPEFINVDINSINSHLFLGDSLIVMGSENETGLFLWNYKIHTVVVIDKNSTGVKLASNIVNNLFFDNNNNLWVLSDKVITIFNRSFTNTKFIELSDSTSQKKLTFFFDMCQAIGYYWIASYSNGIIQLDSSFKVKNIFNVKKGLCDNGVYQIFPASDNLVITTNNGLSIFSIRKHTFRNYYEADGLHSNSFEEVTGIIKNGLIYAGGLKGFSIINPALFIGNNIPPVLYINKVISEITGGEIDTSNLYFQTFHVPNNAIQTSIYFSALNFSNPTRTTYAYRITEKSKEWINLSTQNFVTLISVPPGKYHLQVKAANEDGIWSEPKELVLEFLPKWYQTWWFKLLVFAATASIILAFYRYRIAQIKKQHEIRKNIATDLHDDLGSTLNSVKVFTNLAIRGVKQEESLQQIKDNLNEASIGLRDMIWVLDDSLDTVDELVTRIKQYAIPLAEASDMEGNVKADSEINNRKLTKEEKRNLFLVCKEAINNSIKYSGASKITVTISASGKKIQIAIADNGKGFNAGEIKKGYGLKNMQYRSGQIKYQVYLDSSPGKGTQIVILPI